MDSCDCEESNPMKTREYTICRNCGIELGPIYENNLPHEQVAHFATPLTMIDVHPSINNTLSKLSEFVNMTMETRMDIIERAYQFNKMGLNYVLSTKEAFLEIFPNIDIGITTKNKKKIEQQTQIHTKCTNQCSDKCSISYFNKQLFNKFEKVHKIVENGIAKNQNIDDILKRIKFPKTKYYKYRDQKYTHIKKQSISDIRNPKHKAKRVITPFISDYIIDNKDQTLKMLQVNIKEIYKTEIHITTIHYHRKKINDAITDI